MQAFGDWEAKTPPARFALLLNPDTELPPTALADMLAFMDVHTDAGVAGPKLVLPNGDLDLLCWLGSRLGRGLGGGVLGAALRWGWRGRALFLRWRPQRGPAHIRKKSARGQGQNQYQSYEEYQ